jgi:hypothetical protein
MTMAGPHYWVVLTLLVEVAEDTLRTLAPNHLIPAILLRFCTCPGFFAADVACSLERHLARQRESASKSTDRTSAKWMDVMCITKLNHIFGMLAITATLRDAKAAPGGDEGGLTEAV